MPTFISFSFTRAFSADMTAAPSRYARFNYTTHIYDAALKMACLAIGLLSRKKLMPFSWAGRSPATAIGCAFYHGILNLCLREKDASS